MTELVAGYRGIVCDLDGVVYRGGSAVPHAVEALGGARGRGVGIAYATNNASRPPATVVEHLRSLGLDLDDGDVVTSAMAGAHHLAQALEPGAVVLAVGGEGVVEALESVGLTPVRSADVVASDTVAAVMQGFGRDVAWTDLAEAAARVHDGAMWVATNLDLTVPTDRGISPGNGTLVAAVRAAAGVEPVSVGKPLPPLYLLCAERLGCRPEETLAIGDRLDTDIDGAVRTGMDGLFVLTGVNGPVDIVLAPATLRPTYLGRDLRVLHEEYVHPETRVEGGTTHATCGGAVVSIGDGWHLRGAGTPSERLRAVVAAGVRHHDEGRDLGTWPDVLAWILEEDS